MHSTFTLGNVPCALCLVPCVLRGGSHSNVLAVCCNNRRYDAFSGGVQSSLVSQQKQTVTVGALGRSFDFGAWEAMHTEVSRKFTLQEVETYADRCGFDVVRHFTDEHGWFVDSLWRVKKAL